MIIVCLLHQAMLDAIPPLRAIAISLSGNLTYADDLVRTASSGSARSCTPAREAPRSCRLDEVNTAELLVQD